MASRPHPHTQISTTYHGGRKYQHQFLSVVGGPSRARVNRRKQTGLSPIVLSVFVCTDSRVCRGLRFESKKIL